MVSEASGSAASRAGRAASRDLSALLEFAARISHDAGDLTLSHFQRGVAFETKADGTPVTLADRAAETRLRALIADTFPDDAILGEEEGSTGAANAVWRWILDPIDGTRSFVHGVPLYAVLIGLEHLGEPVLGVIHLPALGETVAAAAGQGCYLDGSRCRVSDTNELARAVALTSDLGITASSPVGEGWGALVSSVEFARTWGDAYGHAMVATGRADIMLDPVDFKPWDAAPLLPVITEAGGRFTSLAGDATIHGGSGLSTNGHLHDQVLALLTGSG
jgi:histidinol-phosphatase